MRIIEESPTRDPPGFTHPEWAERFPWLVQGTTGAGSEDEPFDLGLFSTASTPQDVLDRWARLGHWAGSASTVHAHQVHGAAVRVHDRPPPGLHLAPPCDGHATRTPGVLLAVTVADCVPVSVVDADRRAMALLHAGWRGAAAGILERGLAVLGERFGSRPAKLHVHLGPSICGDCYEVGPEVFGALGLPEPGGPAPLDLRAVLAERCVARGVPEGYVTASGLCTLCGGGLFSHRAGHRERQAGYLGLRS